ncbi:MAG: hypothetical protein AB8F95_18940 [Bacteroidia bacterium]
MRLGKNKQVLAVLFMLLLLISCKKSSKQSIIIMENDTTSVIHFNPPIVTLLDSLQEDSLLKHLIFEDVQNITFREHLSERESQSLFLSRHFAPKNITDIYSRGNSIFRAPTLLSIKTPDSFSTLSTTLLSFSRRQYTANEESLFKAGFIIYKTEVGFKFISPPNCGNRRLGLKIKAKLEQAGVPYIWGHCGGGY